MFPASRRETSRKAFFLGENQFLAMFLWPQEVTDPHPPTTGPRRNSPQNRIAGIGKPRKTRFGENQVSMFSWPRWVIGPPSPISEGTEVRFMFPASGNLEKRVLAKISFRCFFWPCGHPHPQANNLWLLDSSLREREWVRFSKGYLRFEFPESRNPRICTFRKTRFWLAVHSCPWQPLRLWVMRSAWPRIRVFRIEKLQNMHFFKYSILIGCSQLSLATAKDMIHVTSPTSDSSSLYQKTSRYALFPKLDSDWLFAVVLSNVLSNESRDQPDVGFEFPASENPRIWTFL